MDDILITGSNSSIIQTLISDLHKAFAVRDLGPARFFLGIDLQPHPDGLLLSQAHYISSILRRANMSNCKPISTPATVASSSTNNALLDDPSQYQSIVGALQYVTLTRPDISFSVNRVCQSMHAPTQENWAAVKRILRYLQFTSTHGLLLRHRSLITLHVFSDADWAGCSTDRRSTGGYAIFLGHNLVS